MILVAVKIMFRIGNPHNFLHVKHCSVVPKRSTSIFRGTIHVAHGVFYIAKYLKITKNTS